MNMRWIFCVTVLVLINNVSMEKDPKIVEVVPGGSVVLPCLYTKKTDNMYWTFQDGSEVCSIIKGVKKMKQESRYENRVDIFPSEIKDGNFSIQLHNVTKSDEGTYICQIGNDDHLVSLRVEEKQTITGRTLVTAVSTKSPNGEPRRRADILLMFLLGCPLLYWLLF